MDKSEKFWDRTAQRYQSQVNAEDETAMLTLAHARKYLQSSDTVLDFACATGKYAFEIAPLVKEVWGIDISSEMISAAKRNAAERYLANVQFMQAEITDPRLADISFNAILAFNILHLVENPSQVAEKIKELLKPGGIFISVTPCLRAGGSLVRSLIRLSSALRIVPAVHSFEPSEVETLVTNAHFKILDNQVMAGSTFNIFLAAKRIQ